MALELDAITIGGETALIKAAESGHMDICVDLLRAGANPFLTDNNGRRADQYAKINHPDKNIDQML